MDTATHIAIGITLGGLAGIDSNVAMSPTTDFAVMIGTLAGALIPDIDTVLKTRGNAIYIKNHRGATHTIPALFVWPTLITFILWFFFREASIGSIWVWIFISVFLHIATDVFNGYGTQFLKPFVNKWVAVGAINTFDPIIFTVHVAGIVAWAFKFPRVPIFVTVYSIMALYYFYRLYVRNHIAKKIQSEFKNVEQIIIGSTLKTHIWNIAFRTTTEDYVGEFSKGEIRIIDVFERNELPACEKYIAATTDENIKAFLSFSPLWRHEVSQHKGLTEFKLIDLRYRTKKTYPFFAVVYINEQNEVVSSYTGWIFNKEKLKKKVKLHEHS